MKKFFAGLIVLTAVCNMASTLLSWPATHRSSNHAENNETACHNEREEMDDHVEKGVFQMNKIWALGIAGLSLLPLTAHAAPTKPKPAKMVTLYQAAVCHMYYTPAQAKMYHYACPDSKGKMTKVMVSPAVAKMQEAKTSAALALKTAK